MLKSKIVHLKDKLYKQALKQSAEFCNNEMSSRAKVGGFRTNKEMYEWIKQNSTDLAKFEYEATGYVDAYPIHINIWR